MNTNIPSRLSDSELVVEMKRLVHCERQTTVSLIGHLAEFDARRLYLGAGFSSLFTYCTEVLRLSEHEAYNRIEAARTARRFPLVLDLLGDGRLNLTTVRLLAPHLTDENHEELVATASGKSKRAVEELLARHAPRPAVPATVRRLPAAKQMPALPTADAIVTVRSSPPPSAPRETAAATSPPSPPTRRPEVRVLAPDQYAIKFTASAKTCEKLRLAQDLLRHVVPNGDTAEIFDRALTALLADLARKKFAATRRPGASRAHASSSRHIPAQVKRAVWLRDGGRCAFTGHGGRRCAERGFLEFHHVEPYAAGGEATIGNIQLRCGPHNRYEAELYYGAGEVRESGARLRVDSFRTEFTPRAAPHSPSAGP